jgi:hypothetical protein
MKNKQFETTISDQTSKIKELNFEIKKHKGYEKKAKENDQKAKLELYSMKSKHAEEIKTTKASLDEHISAKDEM